MWPKPWTKSLKLEQKASHKVKDTHQHDSQVDGDNGFKEEVFEVVGDVGDDDEEHGGDVHGEDGAHQPPCVVLYIVRLVLNTLCCCSCCQISF